MTGTEFNAAQCILQLRLPGQVFFIPVGGTTQALNDIFRIPHRLPGFVELAKLAIHIGQRGIVARQLPGALGRCQANRLLASIDGQAQIAGAEFGTTQFFPGTRRIDAATQFNNAVQLADAALGQPQFLSGAGLTQMAVGQFGIARAGRQGRIQNLLRHRMLELIDWMLIERRHDFLHRARPHRVGLNGGGQQQKNQ